MGYCNLCTNCVTHVFPVPVYRPRTWVCLPCYERFKTCDNCSDYNLCQEHLPDCHKICPKSDKVLLQQKSKAFEQEKKKSEYQVLYEEMTEFSSKNGQMYYIYEGA